jgi:polyhydroxybutyrate depolymerase
MRAPFAALFALFTAVLVSAAPSLESLKITVDGVTREALVAWPSKASEAAAPLVFVFHGHGGTARNAARSMPLHEHWPEAIVVFPQGLPTPGALTDPQGKENGWQKSAGAQGDRDLKFFDALLAELKRGHRVDARRIYATGHSNGGGFTYLLWSERGEEFAAFAPSAALLGRGARQLKPKPVLHVASPQDELVKFAWQQRMLEFVFRLNGAGTFDTSAKGYRLYPGRDGCDVGVFLHNGGHKYPSDQAPALIAQFFRDHPRR